MTRQILLFAVVLFGGLIGRVAAHGDLDEAIQAVSVALANASEDPALLLRRAELHRLHHDWPSAEADYTRVGKLQPEADIVTFGLAQVRLGQGEERTGLGLLNQYLAKHPDAAPARALRAGILEKRGDWKKAEADLAAAVASSSEPQYATERAALLERHGEPGSAARTLDEASLAHGRVPLLEQQALEIQERAGDTDDALRRLDALIAREPRPDIWLARKAKLLAKAGRNAEARAAWQQAATAFEKVPPHRRGTRTNTELAGQIRAALSANPATNP